jgi:hypothetical protein
MQTLALSNISDQTFTTELDGDRYVIRVFTIPGAMASDVMKNEVQLTTGQRITPGSFLIPFFGYQGTGGNFLLLTANDELPDPSQFGITQTLVYLGYQEMVAASKVPNQ